MYDPKIGRWLQTDPSLFAAGDANLYRFVGNDAANATDPTGLAITQVPVSLIATAAWSETLTAHDAAINALAGQAKQYIDGILDPNIFQTAGRFFGLVAKFVNVIKNDILLLELTVAGALCQVQGRYIQIGSTQGPNGTIAQVNGPTAVLPNGGLTLKIPALGSFGVSFKTNIVDSTWADQAKMNFAWVRVQVNATVNGLALKDVVIPMAPIQEKYGVTFGTDFPMSGHCLPMWYQDPHNPNAPINQGIFDWQDWKWK